MDLEAERSLYTAREARGMELNMQNTPLSCQCGKVQGTAKISSKTGNRVVCYCDDCQAFANYLGKGDITLDPFGGTDIVQVTPPQIQIAQGTDLLRCVRLSPNGLLRWYTDCCGTPIANTVSESIPFVGLILACMQVTEDKDQILGPVQFHIFGKFAKGKPPTKLHQGAPFRLVTRNLTRIVWAKLRGQSQPSPFFHATGEPVSSPKILSPQQRKSIPD